MAKTKGINYWKKKANAEFSKFIRLRDALRTTRTKTDVVCCSCGKTYPAFGVGCAQAGHFIPGRGNSILYDEWCVHAQCYNCNVNLKGNWPGYYDFMECEYGLGIINALLEKKRDIVKYTIQDLIEIRDKYKSAYKELEESCS